MWQEHHQLSWWRTCMPLAFKVLTVHCVPIKLGVRRWLLLLLLTQNLSNSFHSFPHTYVSKKGNVFLFSGCGVRLSVWNCSFWRVTFHFLDDRRMKTERYQIEENWNDRRKTCLNTALSTINPTRTTLVLNPGLCVEDPATKNLIQVANAVVRPPKDSTIFEVVIRLILSAQARVQYQTRPCGICGGHYGTTTGFFIQGLRFSCQLSFILI
jgi:hypothetical protein